VDLTNGDLLKYSASAVPHLLDEGLWNRNQVLNVISYWVWRYHKTGSVEQLLKFLIEYYPGEPEWPFLLGELYYRRNELEQAKSSYQVALESCPTHNRALLRLGMIAEVNSARREAAQWYRLYLGKSRDDLLGLRKLELVCALMRENRQHNNDICQITDLGNGFEDSRDATLHRDVIVEWNFEGQNGQRLVDRHQTILAFDSLESLDGDQSGSLIGFASIYHADGGLCQRLEVDSNATYLFDGHFRTEDHGDLDTRILYWELYDENREWIGGGQKRTVRGNINWFYEKTIISPPQNAAFMRVCPALFFNRGQVWIDGVELRVFYDLESSH
jgi:tetratricopeptide (TPR) repeat protein